MDSPSPQRPSATPTRYDVVILGSGIGGAMLACILAKRGVSVLMIEELAHPRFTIGESLIPETGVRLRILAEKHGVPEIGWLGSFHALRDNVSSNCGVKRGFSFMYHRRGEEHRREETNQLPTLTPPFGPDSHLFRQDTDAYLAAVSLAYGAHLRQQTRIAGIDFRPDEVRLTTGTGEVIRAGFLIDAGGMRSQVSTQLGLRDQVPRFRTDTRALYSHFIDVRPADLLFPGGAHGMPSPLGQGTMHHVFDGGWMWIIPFGNHRAATNPLTSVGLVLDRRQHPAAEGAPEDEFRRIIGRYPTIARHFADARAVRPWVGSGRLQYSQRHLLGPRMLQLPHAACFVDPLYSSGMSVLTVAVDLIAETLLAAVADGDFAQERFQHIEDTVNTGFDHYDHIVSTSFDAFASYPLWNAWNRNWMMGNFMGTWGPFSLLMRYRQTGERRFLDQAIAPGRIGVLSSHLPEIRAAMAASSADIAAAGAGRCTPEAASAAIFARLGALDFLPDYMGFGSPEQRSPATFTLPMGIRHVRWYRRHPDARWREQCGFSLLAYSREVLDFVAGQVGDSLRRLHGAVRDVFTAGNDEWRHQPNALRAHVLTPPATATPATADQPLVAAADTHG